MNEAEWNKDLIKKLRKDLEEIANINITKGKVLRDIFIVHEGKNYKLQLGVFDQDIIIYTDTMDISKFKDVQNIKIHNDKNNKTIYIPKIICELKYDGINTHGLITYSDIASNIKAIFPLCKYLLLLRYRNNSSDNKLLRNGKTFDKILCLDDGNAPKKKYEEGDFQNQLVSKNSKNLGDNYNALVDYLKATLNSKELFLK